MRMPANRKLFYGGQWHSALGGLAGTVNPATGESLGEAANANAEDVDRCVAAAWAAFPSWSRTSPTERAASLRQAATILRANSYDIALLDSANNGNPVDIIVRNLEYAAGLVDYFAGLVLELKGHTYPGAPGAMRLSVREPIGVCVRLVAYNHPAMFLAAKFAPAAVAGNCVIMKAPDQAPLSSLLLVELLEKVFPAGVLNLLTGGPGCGEALVAHPRTPMVTLIGGAQTGRAIVRSSADRLKRVLLELGGKNAFIVYPDADIEAASSAAVQGMSFAWCGQSCGSTSRLFLYDSIHDAVLERVIAKARAFVPGIPTNSGTSMGALVSQAHRERVLQYIERGRAQGARLVAGGRPPEDPQLRGGAFLEPTIFADVTPEMQIAREEIFGPVLSVLRWHDEDEMLGWVNGVDYGLTAAVYSGDVARGLRAARRIEAGCIAVNNLAFHALGSPFGGYKQSGIGREECFEELLEFTQLKTINVDLGAAS